MRQYQVDCFLLHLREYRETSVIASALSKELGKVSFVVKGVRGKRNAISGVLQPFNQLQLQLQGNSELKNGHKVELVGKATVLSGRFLYSAMYLNEILMRTLPVEEPVIDVYEAYQCAIHSLHAKQDIEVCLRQFEMLLLHELGYGIDFTSDAISQDTIHPDGNYQFDPERGFIPVMSGVSRCFTGEAIIAIAQQNWTKEALNAAKVISRIALQPLLGNKPLKSRELFR